MDEMERKLGSVLGNPELMQKIMAMAQSLGQPSEPPQEPPGTPEIDIAMLQRLSGLARRSGIDSQQRALLAALKPYLSSERAVSYTQLTLPTRMPV